MTKAKHSIKFQPITIKNIPLYLLMAYSLLIALFYLGQDFHHRVRELPTLVLLLVWFLLFLVSMLEIPWLRRFYQKRTRWLNLLLLFLCPAASFLTLEIMAGNLSREMLQAYYGYNLIWYFLIYYLIFAITCSIRVTVITGNLLLYVAALINYLVYIFRGYPVLPSDLLAWRTGMSVAAGYELSLSKGFLIGSMIMTAMTILGFKLEKGIKRPSIICRFAIIASFLIGYTGVILFFFRTDLIESKIEVIDFYAPKYTYHTYGTAFGFVANVKSMQVEPPEGYSVEVVKQVLGAAAEVSVDTEEEADKPNIIVIMNEAFSDLSMVGDFETNMDYLPYTSSLEENTIKGTLYVSVYGGATSDTEYEFLTGNSMAVMPPNSVPYQQFITRPTASLASYLKDLGYYNIAIHPYTATGYKRDMVYPLLGFDEFLSKETFINPVRIRSYISDRDCYGKIIEQYKEKADQPLFIFAVTMQNHGGYSDSQVFDEEATVRLTDMEGFGVVEQYLSLLRESDLAFEVLTDYFSSVKEPTIILLFGDHQPVAYSSLYSYMERYTDISDAELLERKHKVPFFMWANYDIPEDEVDYISANYLSSFLLEVTGQKGTTYHEYLSTLRDKIPVMNGLFYLDPEGKPHKYNEVTEYDRLIDEYQRVGYYQWGGAP